MKPSESPIVDVLLVAGGSGTRMADSTGGRNKVLLEVGGRPLVSYAFDTFLAWGQFRRLLVVHRPSDLALMQKATLGDRIEERVAFVEGGPERFDSVSNGLAALVESPPEIVVIHDAARPFLTHRMIEESVLAAHQHGSATVAIPLTDTVKRVAGGLLTETIPRNELVRIQTPQAFRFSAIWKAHQALRLRPDSTVTDDCMLLEREGVHTAWVMGDETNLKVTTPWDLEVAEWIAREHRP